MILEYCYYDIAANETEITNSIQKAIKLVPENISVLPPYIKLVKSLLPNSIKISCPIDFPLGILDNKARISLVENSIKNGADLIDAVCPAQLLCNRKYDKFREDIRQLSSVCSATNVELRYILEYRQYSYELLYKIAQVLLDFNIKTCYPSTGFSLDDISDNILAAALINKKVPDINIICTGNLWNTQQATMVKNSKLYGLRVNSINALEILS